MWSSFRTVVWTRLTPANWYRVQETGSMSWGWGSISSLLGGIQFSRWSFIFGINQQGWGIVVDRFTLGILGVKCQSTKQALSIAQSNSAGRHVSLAWDQSESSSINIQPCAPFPCNSCTWNSLLMSDAWISCLTWPFSHSSRSRRKTRRRRAAAPPHLWGCLMFGTYYLSDQIWGNGCDCLKNPKRRINLCHLDDATMALILRDGTF